MGSSQRDEWCQELDQILKSGRKAFEGQYGDQLKKLEAMSRSDIDALVPGAPNTEAYDALLAVIRTASARNWSQARLREGIEKIGDIAVNIASVVGGLL